MSDSDKEWLLDTIHSEYKWYRFERGWKTIMKWFWILLGLAIFINFPRILELVKLALIK
jgi:hypothetical protein